MLIGVKGKMVGNLTVKRFEGLKGRKNIETSRF